MTYTIAPIAICHSPYKQKFSIPRQPQLAPSAWGKIELNVSHDAVASVQGLEQYSHIWLTFLFHQNLDKGWKPSVRPPRLGGNKKMGVFATRSTFRPNGLGQSVVRLESIEVMNTKVILHVSGLDLVDQTPIIDIKPYLPYADALPNATAGIAQHGPETKEVAISPKVQQDIKVLYPEDPQRMLDFIIEVLSQDPRPAHQQNKEDFKVYYTTLEHINIHWQCIEQTISVLKAESTLSSEI